jgi:hypothetical protein
MCGHRMQDSCRRFATCRVNRTGPPLGLHRECQSRRLRTTLHCRIGDGGALGGSCSPIADDDGHATKRPSVFSDQPKGDLPDVTDNRSTQLTSPPNRIRPRYCGILCLTPTELQNPTPHLGPDLFSRRKGLRSSQRTRSGSAARTPYGQPDCAFKHRIASCLPRGLEMFTHPSVTLSQNENSALN